MSSRQRIGPSFPSKSDTRASCSWWSPVQANHPAENVRRECCRNAGSDRPGCSRHHAAYASSSSAPPSSFASKTYSGTACVCGGPCSSWFSLRLRNRALFFALVVNPVNVSGLAVEVEDYGAVRLNDHFEIRALDYRAAIARLIGFHHDSPLIFAPTNQSVHPGSSPGRMRDE